MVKAPRKRRDFAFLHSVGRTRPIVSTSRVGKWQSHCVCPTIRVDLTEHRARACASMKHFPVSPLCVKQDFPYSILPAFAQGLVYFIACAIEDDAVSKTVRVNNDRGSKLLGKDPGVALIVAGHTFEPVAREKTSILRPKKISRPDIASNRL